jgi:tRNA modification GTPase
MSRPASLDDTIVAPATAAAEAAVAIVRISGPRARSIGAALAPPRSPRASHRLYRVHLRDAGGAPLDDGLVVEMHGPRSYTGEDVVELHVHGGRGVVDAVLNACLVAGARLAEPGEFTLRAFLRGRMDLAQAEAVGDLIGATSESQRRIAVEQLGGALSDTVTRLLEDLEGVLAAWRALLDFPEQVGDAEPAADGRAAVLGRVRRELQVLIEQARLDLGRRPQVVLCGAPNSGKSSLLNALVGERRVLVDAAPGTTRDPVEVELAVEGVRVSVWDTAGLRDEAAGLERDGIELAWARLARADRAVWLASVEGPVWPPPELRSKTLVVGSKADLAPAAGREALRREAASQGVELWGFVSTRSGEGVTELRRWLGRLAPAAASDGVVIVRERHVQALRVASAALERVEAGLRDGLTLDVLAIELEHASKSLGEVLGRDVDLDVLDRIFADFCLGK